MLRLLDVLRTECTKVRERVRRSSPAKRGHRRAGPNGGGAFSADASELAPTWRFDRPVLRAVSLWNASAFEFTHTARRTTSCTRFCETVCDLAHTLTAADMLTRRNESLSLRRHLCRLQPGRRAWLAGLCPRGGVSARVSAGNGQLRPRLVSSVSYLSSRQPLAMMRP